MKKKQKMKTSKDKENIEKFNNLVIAALSFAENNKIAWQTAAVIGSSHICEFSCHHSNGNLTEIFSLLTYAMGCSAFNRINEDELDAMVEHLDIRIGIGEKVTGNENQAAAIIIFFVQQTLDAMLKSNHSQFQRVH